MVPHLITALNGPINELEQRILDSMPAIERWFRLEWMEHTPPFYTSVDIRNAGFKLAQVDTNLYPGGWNNLTPEMLPLAVQAAMAARGIAYLKADWTRGDPAITALLRAHGREGVPLYLFWPPGGGEALILPEVLTEAMVLRQIGAP